MSPDDDRTRLSGGADAPTLLSNSEEATMLSPFSGSGTVPSERPGLEDGQPFGPYRIVRLLGRGGMGEVYEAEHLDTGRHVALKLLRGRIDRVEDRERFLQEGQMAASVSDPHTVYVFGSEEIEGLSAISMQLVPGGTLKDRVAEHGPQPVSDAVAAVIDIISGLDAALSAGILHRDIKPSNCFVDSDGSVKVGDFGLSIPASGRIAERSFMGTPQYASPEQLRGDALDVRSDIYAVGATLHYLLTGAPPFEGKDFTVLIDRVKNEPPPMVHRIRSGVPAKLGAVIARCLAKNPADRPSSYQDLAHALRPFSISGAPARLDVRILAGVVDYLVIAIPAGILNTSFGPPGARRGNTTVDLDPWTFVVGVLYFAICEGLWSRTLGKRLLGLRVLSGTGAISWRQAAGRAVIYYAPALLMFVPTVVMGMRSFAEYLVANPGLSASAGIAQVVLMLLLFSTMRRKNGYAAVQDLLTKTRVVKDVSRELRRGDSTPGGRTFRSGETDGVSESAQRRLGPFIVGRELASLGEARLFDGVDPILKRSVWLVESSNEAPETPKTRRDVARVGRLHWLAGRRAPGDSWDAFEAPQGAPLPAGGAGTAWPVVHGWLNDLATELAAAERDGTTPPLCVDRVWIRPDGRAVLLDWPAPGTEARAEPATAQQLLTAVGECASAPVPASAVAALDRWRKKRSVPLAELIGDLAIVTASSGTVTRSRRAGPLFLAAAPVIFMLGIAAVANYINKPTPHDRFVTNELLDDLSKEREPGRQQALKVYLAGALRAELIAADAPWRSADADDKDDIARRALADEAAALTPSPAEVAEARTMLAPALQRAEKEFSNQDNPTTIFVALLLVGSGMSLAGGLVSVLVRPSGFVLSSLGLAVITGRGREIGRVRAVLRLIVAWLPLLIYGAFLAWPVTRDAVFSISVASLAAAPTFIGFVWSLLRPTRGPHDWTVGTSIGSR